MTLNDIMFYLFAGSILTFSLLTVTSRRILRSAVYLLFVLVEIFLKCLFLAFLSSLYAVLSLGNFKSSDLFVGLYHVRNSRSTNLNE